MDKETPIHAEIGSVARLIKCYKPGGEGYRSIPSYNDDNSEKVITALLFICANFGAPLQVQPLLCESGCCRPGKKNIFLD
jgi:hypothetical protein